jgi:hypothetical protein
VNGKMAFLTGKYCGMNSKHRLKIPSQFRLSEGDKITGCHRCIGLEQCTTRSSGTAQGLLLVPN